MAMETYSYGLRDLKIATWSAANSYGTAVDINAAREFTVTFNVQTDQLEGDDVVVDRFAKVISVSANMAYGSVNQEVLSILTGGTLVSNATYEDLMFDQADNIPYFAIAGRVIGSHGAGDLHVFIPKCSLAGPISYKAGINTYLIPSLDIQGVYEGTANGFGRVRKFAAATALTIPLATS